MHNSHERIFIWHVSRSFLYEACNKYSLQLEYQIKSHFDIKISSTVTRINITGKTKIGFIWKIEMLFSCNYCLQFEEKIKVYS